MNINHILQRIKKEQIIEEHLVRKICKKIIEIFIQQSNLEPIASPVTLVGDIHGQFYDVLKMISIAGQPPKTKYIFIGDFVDRGYNSVQTILLLFSLKILYPKEVYLLRGNHQSRQVSCAYGFHQQIIKKYGSSNLWKVFNNAFDFLPISAIIDNHIMCVHGGLSPDIHALDQIRQINRQQQIPNQGPFGDLMWSDPEDIDGWSHNHRGVGWLFGSKVVDEFNHHNDLSLIVRAHQLVQEGYEQLFKNKNIITVWSAPNYTYRCHNLASVLKIDPQKQKEFVIFTQDQKSKQSVHYRNIIPYFL